MSATLLHGTVDTFAAVLGWTNFDVVIPSKKLITPVKNTADVVKKFLGCVKDAPILYFDNQVKDECARIVKFTTDLEKSIVMCAVGLPKKGILGFDKILSQIVKGFINGVLTVASSAIKDTPGGKLILGFLQIPPCMHTLK
jgi:hypothetical protein